MRQLHRTGYLMTPMPDISRLQELSSADLDALWHSHLGGAMPAHLPRFLLQRLLAYRLHAPTRSV